MVRAVALILLDHSLSSCFGLFLGGLLRHGTWATGVCPRRDAPCICGQQRTARGVSADLRLVSAERSSSSACMFRVRVCCRAIISWFRRFLAIELGAVESRSPSPATQQQCA